MDQGGKKVKQGYDRLQEKQRSPHIVIVFTNVKDPSGFDGDQVQHHKQSEDNQSKYIKKDISVEEMGSDILKCAATYKIASDNIEAIKCSIMKHGGVCLRTWWSDSSKVFKDKDGKYLFYLSDEGRCTHPNRKPESSQHSEVPCTVSALR